MFKELGRFAYRIQIAQRLTETDDGARLRYCSRVLSMTYADSDFFSNIRFSDESHIHLIGYIHRQTTRFLVFERPDVVVKIPLHSARVSIWCAVSGLGILSSYYVETDAQNPLTVNQERYRGIIFAPFVLDLKHFFRARNLLLRRQWMQQDAATAHTAGETLACLQQQFGDRLISRGTEFPFPSYYPYLMVPGTYIWGMLKESVF